MTDIEVCAGGAIEGLYFFVGDDDSYLTVNGNSSRDMLERFFLAAILCTQHW